jgi:hypothetical protein
MFAVIPVSAMVVIVNIIVEIYISVRIKNHRWERTANEERRWLYSNGWSNYDCRRNGF